jgi:hypothetical protein
MARLGDLDAIRPWYQAFTSQVTGQGDGQAAELFVLRATLQLSAVRATGHPAAVC